MYIHVLYVYTFNLTNAKNKRTHSLSDTDKYTHPNTHTDTHTHTHSHTGGRANRGAGIAEYTQGTGTRGH